MENLYSELSEALRERLAAIGDRALREKDPAAHLVSLKNASEKIDRLQTKLPADIAPQLKHYLQRCSYDKALLMLEDLVNRSATL